MIHFSAGWVIIEPLGKISKLEIFLNLYLIKSSRVSYFLSNFYSKAQFEFDSVLTYTQSQITFRNRYSDVEPFFTKLKPGEKNNRSVKINTVQSG